MMLRRLLCVILAGLLLPGVAWADPVTVGFILMSSVDILGFAVSTMTLLSVGAGAYLSISARNKANRARAAARANYNAGLQDRQVTVLNAAPPQRMILGRCETGGAVIAMFTTDKRRPDGSTKPDAYKHLVIRWADHQCHAIHDIKIDGVSIGALDDGNSATGADFAAADQAQIRQADASGSVRSIALPGVTAVLAVVLEGNDRQASFGLPQGGANGWSLSGSTLSLPNAVATYDKYDDGTAITVEPTSDYTWRVEYQVSAVTAAAGLGNVVSAGSTVRVVHHLGDPDQAVDATLNALIPAQWTADHRLRGKCYSVVTLDLERTQFQGGPPGITADISGALIYDRRNGVTAWSDNPALCIDHWLRSAFGYSVALADVDAASVIAAANACDTTTSFTVGATTTTGRRYTCNGVISADSAKEAVLQDLCESMAGWASYGGNWRILAGTWVPPVMTLGDDDLAGPITIIQAGEPSSEIFNGVRGQYVPAGTSVAADFEPYANATFVAADGRALWTDVDLPFTNDKARAKNLCRIKTEQSRNGLVIHYPAKLKAWPLQAGDRVAINSAEYGFNGKPFRLTDWGFGLSSPVGLTLQEDDAAAYDDADAAVADPTPNTDLPNPWVVPELTSLTLASGTAELQKLGDGTIISRVKATWPRSTAPYMDGGRIELSWRTVGRTAWTIVNAAGDDTEAYLTGVADATVIIVSAVVVNANGARSAAVSRSHIVLGKTEAPAAVMFGTPVMQPGRVRIPYDACPDADYATTLLRVGSSWAAGTPLPGEGDATGYNWAWPHLGSYIVWARHVDTSGNAGLAVAIVVSVTSAIYVPGSSVIAPPEWLNSNVGLPRGQALSVNPECNLPAEWNPSGSGAFTFVSGVVGVPYQTGVGNSAGTGGMTLISKTPTPIDPTRRLRVSAFAYSNNGTGQAYLGIAWLDKTGAAINSSVAVPAGWSNGTYSYFGLVNQTPSAAGQRYAQEFGSGVSGVAIPSNAASALLVYLPNYSGTTDARHYVTDFKIEDITDVAAAQSAANAASSAASTAATNAASALSYLATMRSNGYLDAAEKPALIREWNALSGENAGILSRANAFDLTYSNSADYVAYSDAFNNMVAYLNAMSPSWNDTSADTEITPAVDQAKWLALYNGRQALLNKVAEVAGTRATWAGIPVGSGKPADNATKNTHYYQDTDPGAVDDGSIWISSTRAWQRVGGAWRPYVGSGSVGTGELANQAANEVVVFFDAAGISHSNMG